MGVVSKPWARLSSPDLEPCILKFVTAHQNNDEMMLTGMLADGPGYDDLIAGLSSGSLIMELHLTFTEESAVVVGDVSHLEVTQGEETQIGLTLRNIERV